MYFSKILPFLFGTDVSAGVYDTHDKCMTNTYSTSDTILSVEYSSSRVHTSESGTYGYWKIGSTVSQNGNLLRIEQGGADGESGKDGSPISTLLRGDMRRTFYMSTYNGEKSCSSLGWDEDNSYEDLPAMFPFPIDFIGVYDLGASSGKTKKIGSSLMAEEYIVSGNDGDYSYAQTMIVEFVNGDECYPVQQKIVAIGDSAEFGPESEHSLMVFEDWNEVKTIEAGTWDIAPECVNKLGEFVEGDKSDKTSEGRRGH
jgi:hypothetical protein